MELSERLTELRKEKNLSQAELADALNVSRQSVSLWENGSTVPALDKLQFLAEFYGVTLDELFYSVEGKPKRRPHRRQRRTLNGNGFISAPPLWSLCYLSRF